MDTEKTRFPKYDGRSYETQDVELRPVIKFGAFLAIAVILSFIVSIWIHRLIVPERPTKINSERPEAMQRVLPPEPRLQADPLKDWKEFAAKEEAKINSYKWVDLNTGKAQIPVERAKEIVLKKGLPQPSTAGSTSQPAAGEQNPQPAVGTQGQGGDANAQ